MRFTLPSFILAVLSAVAPWPALAMQADPPRLTERGVFVYGTLVLDFHRGAEVYGRFRRLANCSTEELYCIDGDYFNVVLPRFCAGAGITEGSVWRAGNLETRVIGRDGPWPAGGRSESPDTVYYLHTNERPEVVFAYSRSGGIVRVYYDPRSSFSPREAVDLVEMARSGRMAAFTREIIGDPQRDHLSLELLTLDQLGACLSDEFRRRPSN